MEDSGDQLGWVSLWVSRALTRTASNGYKSNIALILIIGYEMDLEQHYSKRLKKVLPMGIEAIKLLEKNTEESEVAKDGKTKGNGLKHAALERRHCTVMILLENRALENRADISYISGFRSNALGSASENGNLPMVQLLISKGAGVDT